MHQQQEKFYVTLHPNIFATRESFNLARITHDFKKGIAAPTLHTVEEILQFSSQGRAYIPSFIENEDDNYYFISSRLIFIDVDDEDMVTIPLQVLKDLREICAGIYYTGSHGIKGNRYRLMFVLDRAIRSQDEYKAIFKQLTARLIKSGIPADKSSQDGLQRIRTAMNGYVVGNVNARLSVNEYLELDKLEQQRVQKANAYKKVKNITSLTDYKERDNTITYQELLTMANHIGYIPSGSGQKEDWVHCALGLKSYANSGMITQEQGEELFDIVSGGEQSAGAWNKLNPNTVTIGSFIAVAQKRGYKRKFNYYHAIGQAPSKNVETVKFDEYIDVEFVKELLSSEQQVLLDAATGSGKTSSVINAAKELSIDGLPSRYYLFAVPTIAIAKQVAREFDILAVVGELNNVYTAIKRYSDEYKRVIVATYDMCLAIVDILKRINPFSSFTLIVDEIHHFVASYTYRAQAIEELEALRQRAKGFIGLSGTPQDVLKDGFDRHIKVKTNKETAPCRTFGAITWNRTKDENTEITEKKALVQLIKARVQRGKRLLIFIQNKDMINSVQKILIDSSIITHTVTSDTKNSNSSYLKIVNESRFPSGVQVILSTSVMSDGINIVMDKNDLECIVVCSQKSQFFDPSFIRQCSNRFRATKDFQFYDYFYLFMPASNHETEYFFNMESAYSYIDRLATNATSLLNSEFPRLDDKRLAPIAALEKKYGIHIDETANEFKSKPLKLRKTCYTDKTTFYEFYKNKFIEACAELLDMPAAPTVSIEKLLQQKEVEVSNVAQTLEMLRQTALMDDEYKSSQIKQTFTRDVYKALQEQSDIAELKQIVNEFRKASTMIHFKALENMCHVVDYETCLSLVEHVTSNKNMYAFTELVEALSKISYFEAIRRDTPTKKIFKELKKYVGKPMTAGEVKEMITAISKKLKLSKETDVKTIYQNYFEHHSSRSNKERYTTIEVLTVSAVATKFNVTVEVVLQAMHKISENDTDIQRVILKIKA